MTAKEYLMQYRYKKRELGLINEQLREAQGVGLTGVNMDGMPKGSNVGNPTESAIIKLVELEATLERKKQAALEIMADIERVINRVDNENYKYILLNYFILEKRLDEISLNFYSYGHTKRLFKAALKEVEKLKAF